MTALSLPAELWMIIIRQVVTTWSESSFVPAADNLDCVRGLALSCKRLHAVVTAVGHENLVLDGYEDFVYLWSVPCDSVRQLRINALLPARQMFTNTFHANLSSYAFLTSLSLCSPEPAQTCARLPDLAFAPCLRRLDLRCNADRTPEFWDAVCVRLPKLEELRLGATEYLGADEGKYSTPRGERARVLDGVEFATSLAPRLSGSPHLRVLSLHRTLNESHTEHGVPLFLSRTDVATQEDAATRILARALPRLSRVLWTDPWKTVEEGERMQRSTRIDRTEKDGEVDIILIRTEDDFTGMMLSTHRVGYKLPVMF